MTQQLTGEKLEQLLAAARQDEPSQAQREAYKNIFQYVNATAGLQTADSIMNRISQWIQAKLVWDSRTGPQLQGMRSAVQDGYRMRYNAGQTNIELAIEQAGRLRHLEGEIYVADDEHLLADTGPALITLLRHGRIVAETMSDFDGRFDFPDLEVGDYAMTLFLSNDSRIELVAVDVL